MSGISGYSVYPFDMYYDTRVSSSSCESKNLIVTFSNHRGEWIVLEGFKALIILAAISM